MKNDSASDWPPLRFTAVLWQCVRVHNTLPIEYFATIKIITMKIRQKYHPRKHIVRAFWPREGFRASWNNIYPRVSEHGFALEKKKQNYKYFVIYLLSLFFPRRERPRKQFFAETYVSRQLSIMTTSGKKNYTLYYCTRLF